MSKPGFKGMWLPPEEDPRDESNTRGERDCLTSYLENYRTTLRLKCDGLDAAQLGTRSVPPSSLSLLGMIRHMARVEHHWFRVAIEGADQPRIFDDGDGGFAFGEVTDDLVAEAWDAWDREVDHARGVLAGVQLDDVVLRPHDVEVRDIVVHMIEEYARHCGHADLLRECIDGRAGQ